MFNTLTAGDIQQTLDHFRRSFDQLFEGVSGAAPERARESSEWNFSPGIESVWADDRLRLRIVIPGVSAEDVKVSVQGNQLVVEGERKVPEAYGKAAYGFRQLAYGKFRRVLDLPNGLDFEKLSCHLHDGLLDMEIPVAEAMKPRQIPISVEGGERKAIGA